MNSLPWLVSNSLTDLLSGRGKRRILVMEAYFDESKSYGHFRKTCVAGFVADKERWSHFERRWSEYLKNFNIPFFHAKDPKCKILKPYLLRTILNCDLKAIAVSVDPFKYAHYASPHYKTRFGNAYSACCIACVWKIQRWSFGLADPLGNEDIPLTATLEYRKDIRFVEETLKTMIGKPGYSIVSVAVGSKEDYMPLQTADFLSHSITTNELQWVRPLGNILQYAEMNQSQMEEVSRKQKALFAYERNLRKRKKKASSKNP
jgi:hypothetical protein